MTLTVITCCFSLSLSYCSSQGNFNYYHHYSLIITSSGGSPSITVCVSNGVFCGFSSCLFVALLIEGLKSDLLSRFLCSPLCWEMCAWPLCGPEHLSVWAGLGRGWLLQRWVSLSLSVSVSLAGEGRESCSCACPSLFRSLSLPPSLSLSLSHSPSLLVSKL